MRARRFLTEGGVLLSLAALFGVLALAFVSPWAVDPPGGAALERYFPQADGDAAFVAVYDPDGNVIEWEAANVARVSGFRARSEWRAGPRQAVDGIVAELGEHFGALKRIAALEVRSVTLTADGALSGTSSFQVRHPAGLTLASLYDPAEQRDLAFDPPALLLPADYLPGREWETSGRLAGVVDYRLAGRVLETGSRETVLGRFDDCVRHELDFVLASDGEVLSANTFVEWVCAGVGIVEGWTYAEDGSLDRYRVTVASTRLGRGVPEQLPPPPMLADEEELGDPQDWVISRVTRVLLTTQTGETTITPTWVPTDPPIVLVAAQGGDLVAVDAGADLGAVRWRFRAGGTVYGTPAFDPVTGFIFFGATDKRLYALDPRGIFAWSFDTGDNVATRPLVSGGLVVFGSEDRNVYGVDAASGELVWRASTGGPVVSSPAAVGAVVAIGSDDGGIYGLDLATGDRRWLHVRDGPVEGEVATDGSSFFAADRDGEVVALDAASGDVRWTAAVGARVRSGVAVAGDLVLAVDGDGALTALDVATGDRRWRDSAAFHVGVPLVGDLGVFVSTEDGRVRMFAADGTLQHEWRGADAASPGDPRSGLRLGPGAGGGAIWLGDDGGVLRRVGPVRLEHAAPLGVAWGVAFIEPPFDGQSLAYAPVEHADSALVMDLSGAIARVDPTSGAAQRIGQLEGFTTTPYVSPVVHAGVLLVVAGDTLHAFGVDDLRPMWTFTGRGGSAAAPTVAGDLVVWTSAAPGFDVRPATVHVLELATGALRWEAEWGDAVVPGGAVVADGVVVAGTRGFDLHTGRPIWRLDDPTLAIGTPAVVGGSVLVGVLDPATDVGEVVSFVAADGTVTWRTVLENAAHPLDRLAVSGRLVIVPGLAVVEALDVSDGRPQWTWRPPGPRFGNLAVDDGRVWVVLVNGDVVVLDATSGLVTHRSADFTLELEPFERGQRPVRIGDHVVVPLGLFLIGLHVP